MRQDEQIRMINTGKTINVFWPTFVAGIAFCICSYLKIEQNSLTVSLGVVGSLVFLIVQCVLLSRSFDSAPIECKTVAKPATWDNPLQKNY
jgi:hypothetical protein